MFLVLIYHVLETTEPIHIFLQGQEILYRWSCIHVLKYLDKKFTKLTWFNRGSDERQYCSPGVDLPIASIMRTAFARYPEYHTSDDSLKML